MGRVEIRFTVMTMSARPVPAQPEAGTAERHASPPPAVASHQGRFWQSSNKCSAGTCCIVEKGNSLLTGSCLLRRATMTPDLLAQRAKTSVCFPSMHYVRSNL